MKQMKKFPACLPKDIFSQALFVPGLISEGAESGYFERTDREDLRKIPDSYVKGSQYLEGRIWNEFGVPTITVEYVTTAASDFPDGKSSEGVTLAVETQMNFIIQNALFFLQNP